jgi:hypothetical protein
VTLPFQDARTLADGARVRALELGKALSIAVVPIDPHGSLVRPPGLVAARAGGDPLALGKRDLITGPGTRRRVHRWPF